MKNQQSARRLKRAGEEYLSRTAPTFRSGFISASVDFADTIDYNKYKLPSISRSDPAYPEQEYWRGRIWPPMNYLVYEALQHANMEEEKRLLAASSREIFLREWREHGHVHENYSGIDGTGCGVDRSCSFYHWGGLLGYIAITQADA